MEVSGNGAVGWVGLDKGIGMGGEAVLPYERITS